MAVGEVVVGKEKVLPEYVGSFHPSVKMILLILIHTHVNFSITAY